MGLRKSVAKFVQRKLQPAKGCDESDAVEDEITHLRADIEERMQDRNFRINTHFTWVDMNRNERENFSALFKTRCWPLIDLEEELWKEFNELWARYWETGSGIKQLMAKNGCNGVDDALEIQCQRSSIVLYSSISPNKENKKGVLV
ncbi:hypothetical protein M441DRAFT_131783 [Trichoderma asperellum CBS 433.97]|uniref:Uncharacterized protein n=1 Tax=Trichoderma asperellum (strain ATCC 204424 / CBS 433.97 / NBRC 101777) TaxID=1042311 RepID=A0A2T3ZGA3_TRIA4|nr:hypothetical protein M441DRAFT_131783 [Trichoderma asperellum CBS 433.97]PTB43813.1 hypothetical protein M441DRAFT_131783 [Trichoderma asperellum CBS 433.97]